jgi:hypothetical protein
VIQVIKKNLLIIASTLALAFAVAVPAVVGAQTPDIDGSLCSGANLSTAPASCAEDAEAEQSINDIIATVINIFSLVVGVVSVIMIIVGGLKYITSGGDSSNITGAKNTILYAIVGLVIVALAQIIVRFVLSRTT